MIPLQAPLPEILEALLSRRAGPPAIPSRRQGAVLLPLVSSGGDLYPKTLEEASVLFTLRTRKVPTHKGEVSFPGGKIEEGESPEEAALRETAEELRIPTGSIRVAGFLGSFPTYTTAWEIRALLGLLPPGPWDPSPREVEAVFQIPLPRLLEERRLQRAPSSLPGPPWPTFLHQSGHRRFTVWGATARILAAFLDLLLEA